MQAVEQRSSDPAASLAQYFTMLSKRNGEVTKISARRTFNRSVLVSLLQTLTDKRARKRVSRPPITSRCWRYAARRRDEFNYGIVSCAMMV